MTTSRKCPLPEGTTCAYRAKVEQLEKDQDQLTYVVSHDLREPLTSLIGFATLLRVRCKEELSGQCLDFLNQIVEGAKHMNQKLDDMVSFSRASNVKRSSFPLGAAVEEARRSLARKIDESQTTIRIMNSMPLVEGDRSLIAQVFQNIFSNSIKYAKKDQAAVIEVRISELPEHWEVRTSDNGIGFDPAHKDRIFNLFQRLYTIREYPGTGIGLALVKRIIERHGGTVWADARPYEGTTITFTLPRKHDSPHITC